MRIVIDLQSCQSGSRLGGIGRYSLELAKAMARNANGHELWIVLNSLLTTAEPEIRHAFADLIPQDKIRVFDIPSNIEEIANNKAKVRAAELVREDFIKSLNPDIVHVTSLFEGFLENVVTSVGYCFPKEKTAVTLYDLIPLVLKDRYLANIDALQHYMGKIENLKRTGLLLSISEFSRKEVIDLLGVDPAHVVNISSAADERFQPTSLTQEHIHLLRQRYGIKQKFLMYTGSFDQRKNHANLIRAFGLLPNDIRRNYQLLIVGNGWNGIYQELREIAKHAGLREDEVIFAGHVADADLLPLYNLCDLFVFPSLAEGFGLPVLEAMSCGTPTICSNCTSLPEVIGRSDVQFDPHRPESIAKTMQQALSDKGFRQTLRDHGLKQSKNFSWDISARKAIEAFEQQHERLTKTKMFSATGKNADIAIGAEVGPRNRDSVIEAIASLDGIASLPDLLVQEISSCIGMNSYQVESISSIAAGQFSNLRVGWVTTWNTRCGIASYSKFIVDHLPAQQIIFAPDAEWMEMPDVDNVKRCWQAGRPDNLNRLYAEVRQSNVEVLIVQFNYGFFDFDWLSNFLKDISNCGIRVFVTLHSTFDDPSENKRLSAIAPTLATCEGLFVHTLNDVNVLRKLGLTNAIFLPQGVVEILPQTDIKHSHEERHVIATYGFALPNKGLIEVVEAFAILSRDKAKNYHLLMINSQYPTPQSADLISAIQVRLLELDLTDKVTLITDYLSDDISLGYLQHADLIVYGYQNTGESSSASVRMGIAAGKPVIVTPSHIFDDVASVVFKLPGYEAAEIADGIKQTLQYLDNKDHNAKIIEKNAALWRVAHGYASIAHHIFWTLAKPKPNKSDYQLTPSSDILILKASALPLKTQVGIVSETGVKTSGQSGALVFGPFISVAPGIYNVVIKGSLGNGVMGSAKVDVAFGAGASVLAENVLTTLPDGAMVSNFFFEVPECGCLDLETRVIVDETSDFEVFEIEISPHN